MGVVYVAEQLSTGRLRALKLMRRWSSGDEDARRFQQEARVGALVESEHIVDVIAAGVDPGLGCPWLAMELLDGCDLAAYLGQRGVLPLSEAAEILRQVCAGLGAAHDRRLVHRDVKPENLFLARSATAVAGYIVKVLDFGVAKLLDTGHKNTCSIGTPAWMSPEQTQARVELTCATDVWPLGLIAFTMLTGHPYWLGAREPGVGLPALLREIVLTPLPVASQRAAELHAPSLPPWFDGWFAGCVNRDLAARFRTAREAWTAFERELRGVESASLAPRADSPNATAVSTTPVPPIAPASPSVVAQPHASQRRLGQGSMLLAAVAVLFLVGGAWYVLRRAARASESGSVATVASAHGHSNSHASVAPSPGKVGERPEGSTQPRTSRKPTSSAAPFAASSTPSTLPDPPMPSGQGASHGARQGRAVSFGSKSRPPAETPPGEGSTTVTPPAAAGADALPALL